MTPFTTVAATAGPSAASARDGAPRCGVTLPPGMCGHVWARRWLSRMDVSVGWRPGAAAHLCTSNAAHDEDDPAPQCGAGGEQP